MMRFSMTFDISLLPSFQNKNPLFTMTYRSWCTLDRKETQYNHVLIIFITFDQLPIFCFLIFHTFSMSTTISKQNYNKMKSNNQPKTKTKLPLINITRNRFVCRLLLLTIYKNKRRHFIIS